MLIYTLPPLTKNSSEGVALGRLLCEAKSLTFSYIIFVSIPRVFSREIVQRKDSLKYSFLVKILLENTLESLNFQSFA